MASSDAVVRSSYISKTALSDKGSSGERNGGTGDIRTVFTREIGVVPPVQHENEALSVSERVVRTVSQKLCRNRGNNRVGDIKEKKGGKRVPFRCLGFYGKVGGCKVGACDEIDISTKRRTTGAELDMPTHSSLIRVDHNASGCCSHGVPDLIWMKNQRKVKEIDGHSTFTLPDDLLEMCLVRLPLPSLHSARLVCKKWRYLTMTSQFVEVRLESLHWSPWLFLFGIIRDGFSAGEIHALDISSDRWHRIHASVLNGRFLFSVASVGSDLYAIGGCSSFGHSGALTGRSSFKTHRGVLVFSPLTGTWCKASPMRIARSRPVVGVFEVSTGFSVPHSRYVRQDRYRVVEASDVYDDPHRLSMRHRQLRDMFNESDYFPESRRKSPKIARKDKRKGRQFVLIIVGGRGSWDEPLDSAEIYDPVIDRWMEIQKLPGDLGAVCSGTICGTTFYVYSEADKLASYDLERGFWIMVHISPPPPRLHEYHPRIVSCEGRLFMLCVSWCERDRQVNHRGKAVRKLLELNLGSLSWTEVSRHPDAPMDWNAAFTVDKSRIYGIEMFKIFGQVLDFLTICDVSGVELQWRRISNKHAAQEANATSCTTKLMAVVRL